MGLRSAEPALALSKPPRLHPSHLSSVKSTLCQAEEGTTPALEARNPPPQPGPGEMLPQVGPSSRKKICASPGSGVKQLIGHFNSTFVLLGTLAATAHSPGPLWRSGTGGGARKAARAGSSKALPAPVCQAPFSSSTAHEAGQQGLAGELQLEQGWLERRAQRCLPLRKSFRCSSTALRPPAHPHHVAFTFWSSEHLGSA